MTLLNQILVLTLFASSLCYGAGSDIILEENVYPNIIAAQKPIALPESVKSLSFDRETNLFDGDILRKAENIAGIFGAATLEKKTTLSGSVRSRKRKFRCIQKPRTNSRNSG